MIKADWTDHEDGIIARDYKTHGVDFVHARMPHRTIDAIQQRAYVLRKRDKHTDALPAELPANALQAAVQRLKLVDEEIAVTMKKRAQIVREISILRSLTPRHTGCARRVA